MAVPDPQRSRAVLIGTSRFIDLALDDLAAVRNNLDDLAACFRDPALWGLPAEHCVVVVDPKRHGDLIDPVHDAANAVEDTLLVYYTGHGLVDYDTNELLLSLVGSVAGRSHTAVRYEYVRREVNNTRARRRIVILDCCYSGRATGMANLTTAVADEAGTEGVYLLASAPPNKQALAPPGERHTAFTGAMLTLLTGGLPNEGPELTLKMIYAHVRSALRSSSRPEPQCRAGNTSGNLALVRNRRWRQSPDLDTPVSAKRPHLLADRYRLEEMLSGGGTTAVWRATDVRTSQRVAIKQLPANPATFDRARMVVTLRDERIVKTLDTIETVGGSDHSLVWIVMEYLQGQVLSNELQTRGRMEPYRAIRIVADVCTALDYAHQRGVGHGAVKARNVMITPDGSVKLLNFGTGDTLAAGSDVYEAGWLLFELLNGSRLVTGSPQSHLFGAGFSWKLSGVVGRAARENPDKRYQSAAAMRDDLLRVLAGRAYPVWHRVLSPRP